MGSFPGLGQAYNIRAQNFILLQGIIGTYQRKDWVEGWYMYLQAHSSTTCVSEVSSLKIFVPASYSHLYVQSKKAKVSRLRIASFKKNVVLLWAEGKNSQPECKQSWWGTSPTHWSLPDCPFMWIDSASEPWTGSAVKQGKLCRNENNLIHKHFLNRYNGTEMLWLIQKQVITGGKWLN